MRALCYSLLLLAVFTFMLCFATAPVSAQSVHALVEQCRDMVGRPLVQACLTRNGRGADWEACRDAASPRVRACVQERINAQQDRTDEASVHCRQTVGRSIWEACMKRRGMATDLEGCRVKAAPPVQTCVRQQLIATF